MKVPQMDTTKFEYSVLGIDVGITNMGLSLSWWDEGWEEFKFVWIELVDIAEVRHERVSKADCTLHHSRHLVDKMEHLFQEYHDLFTDCDYIAVELQPIMGLKAVESLIYNKYRDKTYLVHPIKMHIHFGIKHEVYEKRKEFTVEIAKMNLHDPKLMDRFDTYERQHDIADSICIVKYWSVVQRKLHLKEQSRLSAEERFKSRKHLSCNDFFEQFRYKA